MDSLASTAAELSVGNDLTGEACAEYLQLPYGSGADVDINIISPLPSLASIENATRQVYALSHSAEQEDDFCARSVGLQCKQIGASAYCALNNSNDFNVTVGSARLLLALCSLKGASAYGVCNTNVLSAVPGALLRAVLNELKFAASSTSNSRARTAKAQSNSRSKKTIVTLSLDLQASQEDGPLRRSGRATGKSSQSQSQSQSQTQEDNDDASDDNNDNNNNNDDDVEADADFDATGEDDEDEKLFGSAPKPKRAGGAGDKAAEARLRVTPASLIALVCELGKHLSLFCQRTEDLLVESCAEALSAAAFLSAVRPEFGLLSTDAAASLVSLGLSGERGNMSLYKALLPALTMSGRDVRLPDVAMHKQRAQCQCVAMDVTARVFGLCGSLHAAWLAAKADADTEAEAEADKNAEHGDSQRSARNGLQQEIPASPAAGGPKAVEEERTPGVAPKMSRADKARVAAAAKRAAAESKAPAGPAKPSSPVQAAAPFRLALPTPYACAVGVLQRMTVGVPDRAQPRSVVLSSIALLLGALAEGEDDESSSNVAPNNEGRSAALHYLLFLEKLSRSPKTSLRAYCLDIAVAVMACDWLWESPAINPSAAGAPATLVAMMVGRCRDVASTVRVRAIGAIGDLLDGLGPESPRAMAQILHRAALGGDLTTLGAPLEGPARSCDLLEVIRARAADEKPMVRAKSLQAFGRAFSLDWPRYVDTTARDADAMSMSPEQFKQGGGSNDDVEWSQLLLLDEDIGVLVLGCADSSLAARKQALSSLSTLVKARPTDKRLQAAWVAAALPLASDPESTVQLRVAQCVQELLVDGAIAWGALPENRKKAPSAKSRGAADTSAKLREQATLAWALLDSVALAGQGHTKLLRAAVVTMLQQGLVSNIKPVVTAVRAACCANLEGKEVVIGGTLQPASISHGGWVLLEALLSHETSRENKNSSSLSSSSSLGLAASGSADFVVECFLARISCGDDVGSSENTDLVRILRVLEKVAPGVSAGDAAKVGKTLQRLLLDMHCDASFAGAAVAVKFALTKAAHFGAGSTADASEDFYADVTQWAGQVLAVAHVVLYGGVWASLPERADSLYPLEEMDTNTSTKVRTALLADRSNGLSEVTRNAMAGALFIVGELALLGFSVEEDEAKRAVGEEGRPRFTVSQNKAFRICVPASLVSLVQLLMDARLPHPEALSSVCDLLHPGDEATTAVTVSNGSGRQPCPEAVRANAFVAMGKLCLRDRSRARDHVNIFLRELLSTTAASSVAKGTTASAAIRSNCLLVLGDLCVRYTNLVDRHIGSMAVCLQDEDVLVRRHALVMLTQLLLQDYLKWRGLLLFRFLAAAVDPDSETAELAKTVLKRTLLVKSPDVFSQHFAEAVLIFNSCTDHPAYVAAATYGSEGASTLVTMDGVSLGGGSARQRARRLRLYGVMMESFSEEQRIHVTAKLVQEVLSYAVDHAATSLKSATASGEATPFECALEDAFLILQSPLLKIGRRVEAEDGDEDDEEFTSAAAAAAVSTATTGNGKANTLAGAKTKVLKTLSRQHLVSHTLPVVASLKHALEAARSPLQGALMDYLVALIKGNRQECDQAFEADPTLKAEVEYDLKQHEREKERLALQRQAEDVERAQREAQGPVAAQDRRLSHPQALLAEMRSPLPKPTGTVAMSPSASTKSPCKSNLVPALRRSLGGPGSAARTPRQALLHSTADEDSEGLADRLMEGAAARSPRRGGLASEAVADAVGEAVAGPLLSHASRRRSWSVVVGKLDDAATAAVESEKQQEQGGENVSPNAATATPAKKRNKLTKKSPPQRSHQKPVKDAEGEGMGEVLRRSRRAK